MLEKVLEWIIGGFKNWKTSAAGTVPAIAILSQQLLGIEITPEVQAAIVVVSVWAVGWFSKDSNTVGKPLDLED